MTRNLLLLLTLRSGPHWGVYGKTKVWHNALAIVKDPNLVQGVLELNGNNTRMIPDKYRATSIEFIIGLRDMLSW